LSKNKLKIGIIVDQNPIPNWKYEIIEKIFHSDFCELCRIDLVENISKEKYIKNSFSQSFLLNYEQKKFIEKPSSFEKKELSDFSKFIHTSKNYISNNELIIDDYNRESNLDVVINLTSFKIQDISIDFIKFGVWFFEPTSKRFNDFSGFNEILNETSLIRINLKSITNNNLKIIAKSYSPTNFLSLHRSTNTVNWNKTKIILLTLEKFYNLKKNHTDFKNEDVINNISDSSNFISKYQYAKLFLKMLQKSMKLKLYNKFYFDQWVLMFDFNSSLSTSFSKFQLIQPEKDRFWADPHIIFEDNYYHVFLEEFPYAKNKGHIILLKLDKNGNVVTKKKILEKSYHLSYPFVFKFDDTYYMIPETHSNHTIDLYESVDFPFTWKFSKNLMKNIDAVDTILYHHNDKWWLFTSISKYEQIKTWDDLYLFYTDDLINGSWKSHPCNPVVSDIRKARSAGKIFSQNNNIIRPSQDNSSGYGGSIVLNKIFFDEENYNEILLENIKPNWNSKIKGLHTIQFDSGLTMIDAKLKRLR
jgi:hypothetical protein